ncbi:GNAT family N-acetyltransferase [Photobacterium sp. S4TG1]|uniref:GNAT family N-acetyltransferase n=1 Tax=Photobacterium TaxID=657 RepID=UPI002E192E76|nr:MULTISPECIES: GNAT family N-acetyltransferase [Photobacterium]MEC6797172.1 GNAT family N-acetyltransferase [Photobacterium sp. S4TG1]MEC6908022.1 GNAT family N-acetyltransferase [Photobacterium piscicola]
MFTVKKATLNDLNKVVPLYKEYLTFYHVDYSEKNPQKYLEERLSNNESVIYYIVDKDDNYVGFTQLYPLFCSLEMNRTWLLYDLFVAESARSHGVAQLLLNQADELAKETDASFIMLSTAVDNLKAQNLYEKNDYEKDVEFFTYLKHLK